MFTSFQKANNDLFEPLPGSPQRSDSGYYRILQVFETLFPNARNEVIAAKERFNKSARDKFRHITGLSLKDEDKRVSIHIEISDEIPPEIFKYLNSLPPHYIELILKQQSLTHSIEFSEFLSSNRSVLLGSSDTTLKKETIRNYQAILEFLNIKSNISDLKMILQNSKSDSMGRYYFKSESIRLYWIPLVLYAELGRFELETVTITTLIHELVHAYTHLGRDKSGDYWQTADFANTDIFIVEGFAQYYTQQVCAEYEYFPQLLKTFNSELRFLGTPYTHFVNWLPNVPRANELVRAVMLNTRQKPKLGYNEFLNELSEIQSVLK